MSQLDELRAKAIAGTLTEAEQDAAIRALRANGQAAAAKGRKETFRTERLLARASTLIKEAVDYHALSLDKDWLKRAKAFIRETRKS